MELQVFLGIHVRNFIALKIMCYQKNGACVILVLKSWLSLFKVLYFQILIVCSRSVPPSVALVRKLIAVLESLEKLPVFTYDSSSSGYGLQILTRRLRFRLERSTGESSLIDRSGRSLKMEPLTTITALERYLLKMVAKQWYDYERHTFNFVKKLKEPSAKITFTHQRDFDENGLIYWIGTNAKYVFILTLSEDRFRLKNVCESFVQCATKKLSC